MYKRQVENDLDHLDGSAIDALRWALLWLSSNRIFVEDDDVISAGRNFLYKDVEYLSKLKPAYLSYTPRLALC